jgi:hypothetical protein
MIAILSWWLVVLGGFDLLKTGVRVASAPEIMAS